MGEFSALLYLLLALPGSFSQCTFRDEIMINSASESESQDYGVYQPHQNIEWKDHTVHYMYDPSMSQSNRQDITKLIDDTIKQYKDNTCMKFIYHQSADGIPANHLFITARTKQDKRCSISGFVDFENLGQKVLMDITFIDKYNHRCDKATPEDKSLVIHEMGHAMGIMHTHKRDDRETYVIYRKECTKPNPGNTNIDQFKIIKQGGKTFGLPYECNSIMHYERNTFNKDDSCNGRVCTCNELTPREDSTCKEIKPGVVPTENDWKMINMAQKCSATTPTNPPPPFSLWEFLKKLFG